MKALSCILLFLSFMSGLLPAQDIIVDVKTFGLEDGLLHRNVRTVFEDRDGLIWIGTEKGLQRFDGHDFKTWNKSDRTGLITNIIYV